jgi:hypothetical protein
MLTKHDLKDIGQIVQDQLQHELEPIKQDLKSKASKQDIATIKKELKNKSTKQNIAYLKSAINQLVEYLEPKTISLDKRVTCIETHLDLPPLSP